MRGLSRREALVFLAKPVNSKPSPVRSRISVVEFNLDCVLFREAKRKVLRE